MGGLFGHDLDDLFAYTTGKRVVIRHRWIGGLYYLTILGIVGYVIGYELILKRGYNAIVPLQGTSE